MVADQKSIYDYISIYDTDGLLLCYPEDIPKPEDLSWIAKTGTTTKNWVYPGSPRLDNKVT
jgi:hypothetical protein